VLRATRCPGFARRTAMSLAVAPETTEPFVQLAPRILRADAPFACQRGTRRVRVTPRYGESAVEVEVRYLWAGAPGAPAVIVQGGISADRDVCTTAEHVAPGWWEALVGRGR